MNKTLEEKLTVDPNNKEFSLAWDLVNNTQKSIFLTGKAGTGKTTFLKYLKANGKKKMAVVAPTGVAAIHAGGVTLHSLFQIPFGPFVPNDKRLRLKPLDGRPKDGSIYSHFKYKEEKKKLLRELELLVIDEVSMVRCDLLDVIDQLLRAFAGKNRHLPFGGVQILLIGDPFQLPPVARREDWDILGKHYTSRFFFHAQGFQQLSPLYIELKKIYRQKDQVFIDLLNEIRINQVAPASLRSLNEKVKPGFRPAPDSGMITLATHKKIVSEINQRELKDLEGDMYYYDGTVQGKFPKSMMPVEQRLGLKVGSQVMFTKNDTSEKKAYYNGMIGRIEELEEDKMCFVGPSNQKIWVERATWFNIEYKWDEKEKTIVEEELGRYTQYPLMLAWAITVHKSQGLTFEKVFADLGNSFDSGQVYVALSRCTNLENLLLRSQIPSSAIRVDHHVRQFSGTATSEAILEKLLRDHKTDELYKKGRKAFREGRYEKSYDLFLEAARIRNDFGKPFAKRLVGIYLNQLGFYKKEHQVQNEKLGRISQLLKNANGYAKELESDIRTAAEQYKTELQKNRDLEQELKVDYQKRRTIQQQLNSEIDKRKKLEVALQKKNSRNLWQRIFNL